MDKYQQTVNTFNRVAEPYWQKFKDFKPYEPTYDWFLQQLPVGPVDVLEIACGPGNVSSYLLHHKPNIKLLGIDLAPNMIKLAQQHNPQATYQLMDARNINTINQTFDAVMCSFCIPYLSWKDAQGLIENMHQKLNSGGLLYLSTTKGSKEDEGYKGSDNAKGQIYVYYHDTSTIKQCIEALGMEVLGQKNITHSHNEESIEDVFILAKKPVD